MRRKTKDREAPKDGPPDKKQRKPGAPDDSAPSFGNATEKVVRQRIDGEFNHGGRTQTPDADVNPAKDLHVER